MDGITFFKLHKSRFPVISRMTGDQFDVFSMSSPSDALFSRFGNIVTKKRWKTSVKNDQGASYTQSRGIIPTEEMPDDNSDTEEDENRTQLHCGRTTKLRQPKITDALEKVDDTGLVTDNENDQEGIIDIVKEIIDNFVE